MAVGSFASFARFVVSRRALATLALAFALVLAPGRAAAVVISEIHHTPPGGDRSLEFVELTNESTTPEDISGYHFTDGITFEIPPRTVLRAGEVLVVCADADAVRARYGIENAIGNFFGRLDSAGERLTLVTQVGVVVQSVRYRDEGKWPVAPDGSGHTLVLRDLRSDSSEPESWTWSPELGGTPGCANFPPLEAGGSEEVVLIDEGDLWRFARGDAPFSSGPPSWWEPAFDDAAWELGPGGFGYADGDDLTVLDAMRHAYTSVACRAAVELTAAEVASGTLTLGVRFDDGFCAWVNGVPVASVNCPEAATHDALATTGHEAAEEELFEVPAGVLVPGRNVIAIVGYNVTIDSTDFSLSPRVILRRAVAPRTEPLVFNELGRGAPADSFVELFNPAPIAQSLDGLRLGSDPTGDGAYVFAAGSSIAPFGFVAVPAATARLDVRLAEVRAFLHDPSGIVIAAAAFDRARPPGTAAQPFAEACYPDGTAERWVTLTPTAGAPNRVREITGIVLNEIFYHPPVDRDGEFLELYNRGAVALDMSGFRLEDGVEFTFPPGTVLPPSGYLVVAEQPSVIEEVYGLGGVLGPWLGRLANDGENIRLVDPWGNTVDDVRYHDGGAWSLWADGRGASLELIDPFQRNDTGAAWAASDESQKAPWERLSYTVDDYRPAGESELHLFLVERGICRIDDVAIRRGGGANHVPGGDFETSTAGWLIEGTHQDSRRITHDAHAGGACLELNASGKGDSTVNRIEVETSPALTSGPYEVSLWARWLRGASVIVGHGEFAAGPWGGRPGPSTNSSANSLGGRFRLSVPRDLGTPGARNSARANLIAESGTGNLGPVIRDVTHAPAVPEPDLPVVVSARVDDADGVESVRVHYREGSAGGAFTALEMGAVPVTPADRLAGTRYRAQLPAAANLRKVVFYIEAVDRAGASRRDPIEAPERTLLYQVVAPRSRTLDAVAVVLDDARTSELSSRRLHSNHLLDGAFIFNERETFHGVGVRYRGSPWGRPERTSYRIRLPKDRSVHPGLDAINLSSRLNGPVEAASYYLTGRAGTLAKPANVPLYHFVTFSFNGAARGTQRFIEPVDGDYFERWFPGADPVALKAVARLSFNDAGSHTRYDGASFDYMETNPENYRFYYNHVTHRSRDDWQGLAELMRVLDPRATSNAEHDALVESVLDVEGFLRVMVPRVFVSDWDTLGIGQGHNAYLFQDARDGLWETVPFDYNQAMPSNQVDFPVFPTFDRGWARLIARPATRRLYLRIASEFLDGAWSTTAAAPFLDAMERDVGISMAGVRSFVGARRNVIASAVDRFNDVTFRITTNGGEDLLVAEDSVVLEGEAPVSVASIVYLTDSAHPQQLLAEWTSPTEWRARLDLFRSSTRFDLVGLDGAGAFLATTAIDVVTSAALAPAFMRGDVNRDGLIEASDALAALLHLYEERPADCEDAIDFDDSGTLDLTDVLGLLNYLFLEGVPPAAPFPAPGRDPSGDALGCTR